MKDSLLGKPFARNKIVECISNILTPMPPKGFANKKPTNTNSILVALNANVLRYIGHCGNIYSLNTNKLS